MLISPPDDPVVVGPVIFLAGPIQGALDWQAEAIRQIGDRTHVANPRRREFPANAFDEQVQWEGRWLHRAAQDGVILFWLAAEHEHRCDRAYAQTTRFELGEWTSAAANDFSIRVVVGCDEAFPGIQYIRQRLAEMFPGQPLHPTLEATVEEAVWRARLA